LNKKIWIIIVGVVAVLAVAVAITVPLVLHANAQKQEEVRKSEERQRTLDEQLDAIYALYEADGADGVVSPDAYRHIEGQYDVEIGVNFESDNLLSKSEVMLGKEENGSVSLYVFKDGHWQYKSNDPVPADSYAFHVAKYVASSTLAPAAITASPQSEVFPSYTYLTYGGYRVYAA